MNDCTVMNNFTNESYVWLWLQEITEICWHTASKWSCQLPQRLRICLQAVSGGNTAIDALRREVLATIVSGQRIHLPYRCMN